MMGRSNRRDSDKAAHSAGPAGRAEGAGSSHPANAASGSTGSAAGAASSGRSVGRNSAPMRRHGRRPMRSSMSGAFLASPDSRPARFELAARVAIQILRHHLPDEMRGIHIGFASAPSPGRDVPTSDHPMLYSVDRATGNILLFRVPIQRAKGLHADDEEHRALFVGYCVYRAVCEYLGREPWDLLPGHFEHY